ncbi:hypothetical protein CHU95_14775 [Niveispirillum lacus]|uniref:GGDEF domain-containing protein n=1 Tax=Niveispirillum lacus TaxID=1981099 RepID=A0A255YY70_9PROT|nr:GGDEF domain-containing protein [Niveispirillum lacus]OYQ33634.1 hypothetical protein CHU95_14775 [Niveispirillum lacus]
MTMVQFFTLSTLIGAVALINFVAMAIVWRIHHDMKGLSAWTGSQLVVATAWFPSLFVNLGLVGDPYYTAFNNVMNLAGLLLLLEGALRFRGIGSGQARLPWLVMTFFITIVMSLINRDDPIARYLFHDAVAVLLLCAAAAAMLWRPASYQRLAHGLTGFYLLVQAVTYLSRWCLAIAASLGWTDLEPQSLNFTIFAILVLCCLGTLYGLILSINAEARQQVVRMGLLDPLTGLDNRRALHQELSRSLAMRGRTGDLLGIAYFDLDGFKQVNDQLGHEAGDAVLVEVARRLRQFVRAQDVAARVGGDEFVVLLHGLRDTACLSSARDRLRQAIEGPLSFIPHRDVDIRISVGTALAPLHGEQADMLLRNADASMYRDKRGRRTASAPQDLGEYAEAGDPLPS